MNWYTKDGYLTAYALDCGYQEMVTTDSGWVVRLYKEHGTYQVRRYHAATQEREWETHRYLKDARKVYNQWAAQ